MPRRSQNCRFVSSVCRSFAVSCSVCRRLLDAFWLFSIPVWCNLRPDIVFLMSLVPSQRKKGLSMSSSQKPGSKILGMISKADAERLLLQWANLRDLPYPQEIDEACRKFIARNSNVLGKLLLDDSMCTGSYLIEF